MYDVSRELVIYADQLKSRSSTAPVVVGASGTEGLSSLIAVPEIRRLSEIAKKRKPRRLVFF